RLPRFNMPLELGLFLGAKRFGDGPQKAKRCLILDQEAFRYQAAISDIAGQDIKTHDGQPGRAIDIVDRYSRYQAALPEICRALRLDPDDLDFNDLWRTMAAWEKANYSGVKAADRRVRPLRNSSRTPASTPRLPHASRSAGQGRRGW